MHLFKELTLFLYSTVRFVKNRKRIVVNLNVNSIWQRVMQRKYTLWLWQKKLKKTLL
jgi:hypothetical protein